MNFVANAHQSAKQAMDTWAALETLYQGGITNGEDIFAKAATVWKLVGKADMAKVELAKSEIVYEELKDVEQVARGNPLIWPLLVQVRAEAKRAELQAEAARVYAEQAVDSDAPTLYYPHPWAFHAAISAELCRDCMEQALEVLRDGKT